MAKLPAAVVMRLSGLASAIEEKAAREEGRTEDATKRWICANYRVPGYLAELAEGEKSDGNKYDLVAVSIMINKSAMQEKEKDLQAGRSMVLHRVNGHTSRGYSRKNFLSVAFNKDDKVISATPVPVMETSRKTWYRMTMLHEKCCIDSITGNSTDFFLVHGEDDIAKAKAHFPAFMRKVMPFHENWSEDVWETIHAIQTNTVASLKYRFSGKGTDETWDQIATLTKDDMNIKELYGYNMSGYHVRFKPEKLRALVCFMYNQELLDKSFIPEEWIGVYEEKAAAAAKEEVAKEEATAMRAAA